MRKGIDIIKQVKEKLGKSADAGDYIDDFKKIRCSTIQRKVR